MKEQVAKRKRKPFTYDIYFESDRGRFKVSIENALDQRSAIQKALERWKDLKGSVILFGKIRLDEVLKGLKSGNGSLRAVRRKAKVISMRKKNPVNKFVYKNEHGSHTSQVYYNSGEYKPYIVTLMNHETGLEIIKEFKTKSGALNYAYKFDNHPEKFEKPMKRKKKTAGKSKRKMNPVGNARQNDPDAIREVFLIASNDGKFYREVTTPIIDLLKKKIKAGKYNHGQALKAWMNWADRAVKFYTISPEGLGERIPSVKFLTKNDRKFLAEEAQNYYELEVRHTNPAKRTQVRKVKRPARKPTTVRKKPVQAKQSARPKRANAGAVIVALNGLQRDKTYKNFLYYGGEVKNVKARAWEASMTQAAIYPTATKAKKIADQIRDKMPVGARLAVVSRNAMPSHIEAVFAKAGFSRKKK